MKGSQRRGRVQESKCQSKEALGPGKAEAQEAGPRGVSSPRSGRDSGQCPCLRPTTWLYPEQQLGHHRLCGEQAREQLSPELLTLLALINPQTPPPQEVSLDCLEKSQINNTS